MKKLNIKIDLIQCPHCKDLFDIEKDGYQMNDIFEIVFCSQECSYQYNLERKGELLEQGYKFNDLSDLS